MDSMKKDLSIIKRKLDNSSAWRVSDKNEHHKAVRKTISSIRIIRLGHGFSSDG